MSKGHSVLILGGGFGGIKVALELDGKVPSGTRITLISDRPYFEYSPSLYRVATSAPPLGVCLPLKELFKRTAVEIQEDKIIEIRPETKTAVGHSGRRYASDFLVVALGSEVDYHGLQLLKSTTFSLKSITDSIRLHTHLHHCLSTMSKAPESEKLSLGHFLVVGGGPTGTELAGELAFHSRRNARRLGLDQSYITIDIIDAGHRLVKTLPEKVSEKVEERLRKLGVNILLNRRILSQDIKEIYLRDMHLKTNTVIWTAGVRPGPLHSQVAGFAQDDKGRVEVDDYLQPKGYSDIFVIGDGASTLTSGTAQSALHQGSYVARSILSKIHQKRSNPYNSKKSAFAIPVGTGWCAVLIGRFVIYGRLGWMLRRLADLRFYLSILPLKQSLSLMFSKKNLNTIDGLVRYVESTQATGGIDTQITAKEPELAA